MINLFNNKKITIKAYTDTDTGIHKYYPPTKPKKPSWFKNLPSATPMGVARAMLQKGQCRTIKTCPAFASLYSKGFMVPLWSDLYLNIGKIGTEDWQYQFADGRSTIQQHSYDQYKGMVNENYVQLKLQSPWVLYADKSVDFIAMKPALEVQSLHGLEIMTGMVNLHKQTTSDVNLFIKREPEEKEIIIKAGTPIYHYIPLQDAKIELVVKALSKESDEFRDTKLVPQQCFVGSMYKEIND
jgi:hypothetical protein